LPPRRRSRHMPPAGNAAADSWVGSGHLEGGTAALVAAPEAGAVEQCTGRATRAVVVDALAYLDEHRAAARVAQRATVQRESRAYTRLEHVGGLAQFRRAGFAARQGS